MAIIATLKNLIKLTRINKPTGIWLLFLPCLFGIFLSYKDNTNYNLKYIIALFFLGSVIMRSAGCIINDILDRKFDKKVKRTKSRPLANKNINLYLALILLAILLIFGLIILLQFNQMTIILGIIAFLLVLLYPLMKRITYYPQLFLGITFNFGIILASSAINNSISVEIALLYASAIFWTLIYDTIYSYQDIEDDLKIGVKSTAIKFGQNPQKILYFFAISQILLLFIIGFMEQMKLVYYFFIYITMFHLLCQIKTCNFKDGQDCLKKFKSNTMLGLIILMGIITGYL